MNVNAGKFDLHDACKEGRLIALQGIIKADPNSVDRYDQNKETPLTIACKQNNLELMKQLIEAGAKLDTKDNDGNILFYSLIRIACENKNNNILNELLCSREIHRWPEWEVTKVMILVIETGHIQGLLCFISHLEPDAENDIAHWLKHYNVNVNEVDCYITLQECIKNKNIEMLELLIENGFFIDIYTDTLSGLDNALNTAVKCGNIEAIKILLQYCNDNSVKPDSSALLFSAMQVENPSIDMVSYLLNIKANPNYWHFGASSLSIAAEKGKLEIFQKLINAGARIEFTQCRNRPKSEERAPYFYCKKEHKLNPLLLAAQKGHTDIVKQLLSLKADPMAIGDNHKLGIKPHTITPLYMALINGHTDCVKAMFCLNNREHKDILKDENILESCIKQERWPLLEYLLEQAPECVSNHQFLKKPIY